MYSNVVLRLASIVLNYDSYCDYIQLHNCIVAAL